MRLITDMQHHIFASFSFVYSSPKNPIFNDPWNIWTKIFAWKISLFSREKKTRQRPIKRNFSHSNLLTEWFLCFWHGKSIGARCIMHSIFFHSENPTLQILQTYWKLRLHAWTSCITFEPKKRANHSMLLKSSMLYKYLCKFHKRYCRIMRAFWIFKWWKEQASGSETSIIFAEQQSISGNHRTRLKHFT